MRAIASKKYNVHEVPGSTANFIQLNINRPPLNDRRVRQAIAYAIDRHQIARFIYLGMSVPASSPVLPSSPFFEPETDQMTYNEQRARALLSAGNLAWHQGDHAAARALLEESVALGRERGDRETFASAVLRAHSAAAGEDRDHRRLEAEGGRNHRARLGYRQL